MPTQEQDLLYSALEIHRTKGKRIRLYNYIYKSKTNVYIANYGPLKANEFSK